MICVYFGLFIVDALKYDFKISLFFFETNFSCSFSGNRSKQSCRYLSGMSSTNFQYLSQAFESDNDEELEFSTTLVRSFLLSAVCVVIMILYRERKRKRKLSWIPFMVFDYYLICWCFCWKWRVATIFILHRNDWGPPAVHQDHRYERIPKNERYPATGRR